MDATEKAMRQLRKAVDKKEKYFKWRSVGDVKKGDLVVGRIGTLTCRQLRYADKSTGSAYFRVMDGRSYPTDDENDWFAIWYFDLESGERRQ